MNSVNIKVKHLKKTREPFAYRGSMKLLILIPILILATFLVRAENILIDSIPKLIKPFESFNLGNKIYNASSLSTISGKIRSNNNSLTVIKVLHIGDSHVKSGFFAEPIIDKLNSYYVSTLKRNVFFNGEVFSKIGTKYSDYSDLSELDNQLIKDKPDLVIISLGINDAFSGSANSRFYEKINHLVFKIKTLSPNSTLLLTTPADGLRKNAKTGVYQVLPEVQYIVSIIIKYATDHHLAYWDLHSQMGGNYSMNRWVEKKLAAPDRIHFTAKGYRLIAQMLFEALKNYL